MATLHIRHAIVLLGAITAVAAAPAAAAGNSSAGTPVTVRVEGKSKTLLASTVVRLHSGSVTKDGAPKGACSTDSEAGALDAATHHRWAGKYYSEYHDYLIDSILGETYKASANYYWEVFADNVSAKGACETAHPHRGEVFLFAAVPLADDAAYPLLITGAPTHAQAGKAFKVKVVYVNAKGKKVALGGARLSGSDFAAVTTSANGTATIKPTKAGTLTLRASHGATTAKVKGVPEKFGYVRAADVAVPVS